MSSMKIPSGKFGRYSSLYSGLKQEVVHDIELASFLFRIGYCEEAHAIFETRLQDVQHLPLVTLEWANGYLQQWRFGKLTEVLERGLQLAAMNDERFDLDRQEYRLMRLFLGFSEITSRGKLGRALQEIDLVRTWLADVPVSEYSDIQVDCIHKYCLTVYLVALNSNKNNPANEMIPLVTGKKVRTWQGLSDLRASMLAQGRFEEALTVLAAEIFSVKAVDRVENLRDYLYRVQQSNSLQQDYRQYLEGSLRLRLADDLKGMDYRLAETELERAETVFNWCIEEWGLKKTEPPIWPLMQIRSIRVELNWEDMDLEMRYLKSLDLAAAFKTTFHKHTATWMAKAARAAQQISVETNSVEYHRNFIRLATEEQEYEVTVLGDIGAAVETHWMLLSDAMRLGARESMELEWLDGLLKSHPDYGLPTILSTIHSHRYFFYNFNGDVAGKAAAQAEIEKLMPDQPTMTGTNLCLSQPLVFDSTNDNGRPQNRDAITEFKAQEDGWLLLWKGSWESGESEVRDLQLLLKWIKEDLQGGVLTVDDSVRLLNMLDANSPLEKIAQLSLAELYDKLFGPKEHPIPDTAWEAQFGVMKSWLGRRSSCSPNNARQYMLLKLQENRARSLRQLDKTANLAIPHYLACIDMIPLLPIPVKDFASTMIYDWKHFISICYLKMYFSKTEHTNIELSKSFVRKAYESHYQALEGWKRVGNAYQRAHAQGWLAFYCLLMIESEAATSQDERRSLREIGLQSLREAEKWLGDYRLDISSGKGLEALFAITNPRTGRWDFHTMALQLLLHEELDDASSVEAWNWIQRSKARSLATTIGLRSSIPEPLLKDIETSQGSHQVFEEQQRMANKIAQASLDERYFIRAALKETQQAMKEKPELRRIVELREGQPLTFDDMSIFMADEVGPVAFVDWFILPGFHKSTSRILMTIARPGSIPTIHSLDVNPDHVNHWIDENLNSQDIERRMRSRGCREDYVELNGLVKPLADYTKSGDLLIFCPTNKLHRLPLHALEVADKSSPNGFQTLIRRNPIVYCHSASILRHGFWSSVAIDRSQQSLRPTILHGIPQSQDNVTIYPAGRQAVRALGTRLATLPLMNEASTKNAFLQRSVNSNLIHIHSHVSGKEEDPLKHYIEFGAEDPDPEMVPPDDDESNNHTLTTRELLSLPIPSGCHITLIGCSGARFRVEPGDEVLGLVPAFLYAGASSVLSTLWNISDTVGAEFTDAFYKALLGQRADANTSGTMMTRLMQAVYDALGRKINYKGSSVFDIARAYQKAVIHLDKDQTRPLYYWAGFVLHGYWKFKGFQTDYLESLP